MSAGQVSDISRRFEQEYLPIRIGNWSKVNCEFRHRYCQVIDDSTKNSCNPDIGCLYIDDDQTRPKTSDSVMNTIRKLDEFFQSKSMPSISHTQRKEASPDQPSQSPDSAIYISVVPSTDLDGTLEEPEDWQCKLGMTKVYVEFESHSLHCEGCGSDFHSIDEAENHFENQNPLPKEEIVEELVTKSHIYVTTTNQDTEYENQPTLERSRSEEVPNETDQVPEEAEINEEYSPIKKELFKESDHEEGSTSRSETDSILGEFRIFEDRSGKTKTKKKKNKAWKFVKGSFMLVIRILF